MTQVSLMRLKQAKVGNKLKPDCGEQESLCMFDYGLSCAIYIHNCINMVMVPDAFNG